MPRCRMNEEIPLVPFDWSVTAMITRVSAEVPCVMNIFEPFSTQQSPSFTAVVRIAAASLPEPGSVRPQAASVAPFASGTRYFCFCSSVANIAMCAAPRPLCAATDNATLGSTRASSSMQMQ